MVKEIMREIVLSEKNGCLKGVWN